MASHISSRDVAVKGNTLHPGGIMTRQLRRGVSLGRAMREARLLNEVVSAKWLCAVRCLCGDTEAAVVRGFCVEVMRPERTKASESSKRERGKVPLSRRTVRPRSQNRDDTTTKVRLDAFGSVWSTTNCSKDRSARQQLKIF